MRNLSIAVALVAVVAALGLAASAVAAAPGPTVVCTDAFSGTAYNVVVPDENGCDLSGATVTNDVTVGRDSGIFAEGLSVGHDIVLTGPGDLELGGATVGHDVQTVESDIHLERTTIGHDLIAVKPFTVQTGHNEPDSPGGPVRVGHDLSISGTPNGDFLFDGMCSLTVGHNATIANRTVDAGIGFGDNCVFNGEQANTIGYDLVVTHNSAVVGFFGPSSIEVGGNQVGHDLVFTHNSAPGGGFLEVSDNTVANDAICAYNKPVVGSPEPWDGPNTVGGQNSCG